MYVNIKPENIMLCGMDPKHLVQQAHMYLRNRKKKNTWENNSIGCVYMKDKLIEFCKNINIEYVGIASAEPYHDFEATWKRQIERGYISGFEEKDAGKRIYPNRTLEGAKSVIVCLFPYYTGGVEGANLAKYAYGPDYHNIINKKLEKIAKFLQADIPGFHYRAFADNGPFSDRYLAYKAGLGFWGINNHIITDRYGSYVFIGYILNNYPFEVDKPQDKTCLQCMECVRQCPGQCILGDFTINPLKCKSFLTQKKRDLTAEDAEIIKKHALIWGCDVCQDVCPHNRNIAKTAMDDFRKDLKYRLDYAELKRLSNKEFLRLYGDRAFSWRGKGVLLRNYEIIHEGTKENPEKNDSSCSSRA